MKYTLFLGINSQVYSKPVNLQIHVGGRFVDTFQLTENLTNKNLKIKLTDKEKSMLGKLRETPVDRHRSQYHWGLDPDWIETEVTVPQFYKVYELDSKDLHGSIEITVTDSDNNYTNGFMTKDSKICIPIVSILPSHLLEDNGYKLMSNAVKLLKGVGKYERRHGVRCTWQLPQDNLPENLYEFYKKAGMRTREPNYPEKGIDHILTKQKRATQSHYYERHHWPLSGLFYAKLETEEHEKNGLRDHRWWIGGNCNLSYPIRQKHRTKYIGSWGQREIGFVFFAHRHVNTLLTTCKHLINIYNEDQRSNYP